MSARTQLLFTAPWEEMVRRRVDPLGFRGPAVRFAEAVAPACSNRTADARWITLLSWCLREANARLALPSENDADASGARQRSALRYAALRPLEILWVGRSVEALPNFRDRQLPGQLSLRRAIRNEGETNWRDLNGFGFTPGQLERYRFTGPYGAYRVLFRRTPELSGGNGWRTGRLAARLADWVDRQWPSPTGNKESNLSLSRNEEGWKRFWVGQWRNRERHASLDQKIAQLAPRNRREVTKLPSLEAKYLGEALFAASHPLPPAFSDEDKEDTVLATAQMAALRRRAVAKTCGAAGRAKTHAALCERLEHKLGWPSLKGLTAFTRLADAGVTALNELLLALQAPEASTTGTPARPITELVNHDRVRNAIDALRAEAVSWRETTGRQILPPGNVDVCHALAQSLCAVPADDYAGMVEALVAHHITSGGRNKWFLRVETPTQMPNGSPGRPVHALVATTAPNAHGGSRYRFRLWALCRMAVQCGVLPSMPVALQGDGYEDDEDLA